jgi:outer membrane protein OmpA-like peptidoglycan-associated protein
MRNRVMLAASTLALVPTLLLAQQRPAQQPAQRPAQRPAAQPAQRPAAQPAQRPAPAPKPMMAGDHREETWELTAGVGAFAASKGLAGTGNTEIMPGGTLRVGYNLNSMWNISVGTGLGFGKSRATDLTAYATPGAAVTWTPDINQTTSPFLLVGAGLLYQKNPSNSGFGVQVGAGIRHMVGENVALRVEGAMTAASVNSNTVGGGTVTVGLSLFAGAKKVLTTIGVSPAVVTMTSLRQTQQLSAVARDQRGNPMAGQMIAWRSSNPAVATVSQSGAVTAAGDGSATITASSGAVSGTAAVTVSRTTATVAVAPATARFNALGGTQQLTASARDAGSSPIANAAFSWTSSNPSVASVSSTGVVTAVGNGMAQITAASGGRSAAADVTVAQMTSSVTVAPATSALTAAGATAQLTAQAADANGRAMSGKTFTWTSDAAGVATVSATGLATAVANGVAHIGASVDGRSGSGIVTVVIATKASPPIDLPAVGAAPMVLRNVTFRIMGGRQTLTPTSQADLDKVAITMQGTPSSRWEIGGYMNAVGAAARNNQRVSQARADAVKAYLVSKGANAASIQAVGYGNQRPIGNARTAAGRAQSNRVEIKRLQ